MNDSVTYRYPKRIIQSLLTRGHKRTKCINIPSNHFQSTKVHPHKQYQLMSSRTYEAVALWLDKRSIIFYQPVGRKNSRMYYAGILYLYTQLLFLISAYAILSNFPTHETFTFLRRNFCSIFPYAMTNFHFAQVALLCEEPDKFQERLSSHRQPLHNLYQT